MVAHRSTGPGSAQRTPGIDFAAATPVSGTEGGLVTTDYEPIAEQYKRAKLTFLENQAGPSFRAFAR